MYFIEIAIVNLLSLMFHLCLLYTGGWLRRFHAKPKRAGPREGGKAKGGALRIWVWL